MGCVIAAFGSMLLEYGSKFFDRMREWENRTTEHRQRWLLTLGRQLLDLLLSRVNIDVHLFRIERKILDVEPSYRACCSSELLLSHADVTAGRDGQRHDHVSWSRERGVCHEVRAYSR